MNKVVFWLRRLFKQNAVYSFANIFEDLCAEHFAVKLKQPVFVAHGYFKDYDLITADRNRRFECKYEARAAESLNLCFEYSYRNLPSGLAATSADTWLHGVPIDRSRLCVFEFDVQRLRARMLTVPPITAAGDKGRSVIRLLPLSECEKIKTEKHFLTIPWGRMRCYWN